MEAGHPPGSDTILHLPLIIAVLHCSLNDRVAILAIAAPPYVQQPPSWSQFT